MRKAIRAARWSSIAAVAMLIAPLCAQAFDPQPEPPLKEQASKLKAVGNLAKCQTGVLARHVLGAFDPQPEPPRADLLAKCQSKFEKAFLLAEVKCAATGSICPQGDASVVGPRVDALSYGVEAFVSEEVGAVPRFADNGDGTVTDNRTGLQWEQKTGTPASQIDCTANPCPDPHDVNNAYDWTATINGTVPNGSVYSSFLNKLNACTSTDGSSMAGGFAGRCDWRLPTIVELQTIIDLDTTGCGTGSPCIDPILGASLAPFWSSTTAGDGRNAWSVFFFNGLVFNGYKYNLYSARAVRGGS